VHAAPDLRRIGVDVHALHVRPVDHFLDCRVVLAVRRHGRSREKDAGQHQPRSNSLRHLVSLS
jgi:hypothetical protein